VAPGVPFCPACNAPQIRVTTESEKVAAVGGDANIAAWPADAPAVESGHVIHWRAGFARASAAAILCLALFQLLSMLTQSAAIVFLVLPASGAFATYLYSRRYPIGLTPGMGARLGLVTGFLFSLVICAFTVLLAVVDRQKMFEEVTQRLKEMAAQNPSPQADALIKQVSTPEGMMAIMVIGVMFLVFLSLALCAAGGAAGAAMRNSSPR
jgi:hypothetical protein